MPSSTFTRLPGLDTLRALAIVAVMLFHLLPFLPESLMPVTQFGWMGVDLFFVLSGYLIGSQLLEPYISGSAPSIMEFYRRRAYRILPAYAVVVLVYFMWPAWREFPGIAPWWQFASFTENLLFLPVHRAFSPAWSLCVEEHFYLILPLLVAVVMRRPSARKTAWLMAGVVLLGIGWRSFALLHIVAPLRAGDGDGVYPAFYRYLYYPTYARLDGLVAGVSLAVVQLFRPRWANALARHGHATLAVGLLLVGAEVWMSRNGLDDATVSALCSTILGLPILSFGLGLVVASAISRNGWLSRVRVPGAKLVATLAFSLYLTHKALAHLVHTMLPTLTAGHGAKATLVYAVACFSVAALLHLTVERPFLALRDRAKNRTNAALEEEMRVDPAL